MEAAGIVTPEQSEQLTRKGLLLAQFTVAYNVVEGAVAVTAGLIAGLVSVVGFGIDFPALNQSPRFWSPSGAPHGCADERKERIALKLGAVTFFILAAYVTYEGTMSLIEGEAPESSRPGCRSWATCVWSSTSRS